MSFLRRALVALIVACSFAVAALFVRWVGEPPTPGTLATRLGLFLMVQSLAAFILVLSVPVPAAGSAFRGRFLAFSLFGLVINLGEVHLARPWTSLFARAFASILVGALFAGLITWVDTRWPNWFKRPAQ
jgi:hypothetical protein